MMFGDWKILKQWNSEFLLRIFKNLENKNVLKKVSKIIKIDKCQMNRKFLKFLKKGEFWNFQNDLLAFNEKFWKFWKKNIDFQKF